MICKEAERVPVAEGENVKLTTHEALAARVAPHVFELIAKSPALEPVMLKLFNTAVTDPPF